MKTLLVQQVAFITSSKLRLKEKKKTHKHLRQNTLNENPLLKDSNTYTCNFLLLSNVYKAHDWRKK